MTTPWPTSQDVSVDDRQGSYAEARALLMIPTNDATGVDGHPGLPELLGLLRDWLPLERIVRQEESLSWAGRLCCWLTTPVRVNCERNCPGERARHADENAPLLQRLAVQTGLHADVPDGVHHRKKSHIALTVTQAISKA
jgi:hypothetical protein